MDKSLDYSTIPLDCRTNNYIESYNYYLKTQLGKKRIINWVNFVHFIKIESIRSIEKLCNNKNFLKNNSKEIDINDDNNKENNENDMECNVDNLINGLKACFIDRNKTNINEIKILNTKIGIINIGLSCYINEILHILLHSDIFITEFLKIIDK